MVAADTVAGAMALLDWHPACIILDLTPPDGSSVTVLRHVRCNNLPIRVAAATGANDPAMLAGAEQLHPNACSASHPTSTAWPSGFPTADAACAGPAQCPAVATR